MSTKYLFRFNGMLPAIASAMRLGFIKKKYFSWKAQKLQIRINKMKSENIFEFNYK